MWSSSQFESNKCYDRDVALGKGSDIHIRMVRPAQSNGDSNNVVCSEQSSETHPGQDSDFVVM